MMQFKYIKTWGNQVKVMVRYKFIKDFTAINKSMT